MEQGNCAVALSGPEHDTCGPIYPRWFRPGCIEYVVKQDECCQSYPAGTHLFIDPLALNINGAGIHVLEHRDTGVRIARNVQYAHNEMRIYSLSDGWEEDRKHHGPEFTVAPADPDPEWYSLGRVRGSFSSFE